MSSHRISRSASAVVLIAVILATAFLAGCGSKAQVPDIVGKAPAEAVRALQEAGYLLGDINIVYSNAVPRGYVVSTNPPAGTEADEGSLVNVSLNMGIAASITVPDVGGMTSAEAESILTTLALVPVAIESNSETVAAGSVMAQSPASGAVLNAGAQVLIQVSKGKAAEKVAVPDVAGKKQADAENAIESAGLKAKAYSVYSNTTAKGVVIAQTPKKGSKVGLGTEVAIAVSLGKGTGAVTVPKVVGKKEADAVSAMSSAGLKATVYRQYSDTVSKGIVIEQLPAGGSTAAAGSAVAVAVSLGKEPAEPVSANVRGSERRRQDRDGRNGSSRDSRIHRADRLAGKQLDARGDCLRAAAGRHIGRACWKRRRHCGCRGSYDTMTHASG